MSAITIGIARAPNTLSRLTLNDQQFGLTRRRLRENIVRAQASAPIVKAYICSWNRIIRSFHSERNRDRPQSVTVTHELVQPDLMKTVASCDDCPVVHVPSPSRRGVLSLLRYRHRPVRIRTVLRHGLEAVALTHYSRDSSPGSNNRRNLGNYRELRCPAIEASSSRLLFISFHRCSPNAPTNWA